MRVLLKQLGLVALMTVWAVGAVWAQNTSNGAGSATTFQTSHTSGKVGIQLSQQLYCDGKSLLQGDVGLIFGLLMVFFGIWALVRGSKMAPALITIIFGALVTALPSLVESSLGGIGQLLSDSNMTGSSTSANATPYSVPNCSSTDNLDLSQQDMDELSGQSNSGNYLPGQR